jgi:hypothetical protein
MMGAATASEMLKWMNNNLPSFSTSIPEHKSEYTLCMFTIASQHVYGNSVEECVITAMGKTGYFEASPKGRINSYLHSQTEKHLPT